jgi:aconitate hydratase
MARAVEKTRKRLARPLCLSEKLLLGHLVDPDTQELEPGRSQLRLLPDRVILQDVLGQTAMLQLMQTRRTAVAVPTSIHCDHLVQARGGAAQDLRDSVAENGEVYDFLRAAAAWYGAEFWPPGAGIIHQVVLETYARPGALIIGTDSHTPNAGGLGACAVGVGGADAVEVMAGLPWELLYPRRIAVVLEGTLNGWTAPKDVILRVAGELTSSGATNAIVEYIGPGARTISATGKATISNMGAELGATTSVFPMDEHIAVYLRATGRAAEAEAALACRELLAPDPQAEDDPERFYDRVLRIDLGALTPHVVGPHAPDRARPLAALAAEVAAPGGSFVDEISTALLGSCTNSSYQDMVRAAAVALQAKSRGLRAAVPLLVTPGSDRVRATLEQDGTLQALRDIGAVVLASACGPCIGQWRRGDAGSRANTIVSTFNRNYPRRNDGSPDTMAFIASPEMVTALALAGRLSFNPLTDSLACPEGGSLRLQAPPAAPEVPDRPAAAATVRAEAPPPEAARRHPSSTLRPDSERLQVLERWPAWDGADFANLPVLMKARGRTTTDHISPAGPWLRFRGHIDRFSDNFLMGAINAYTGAAGRVRNAFTGEEDVSVAAAARDYKARGARWVVVGDGNYGEGSSREHAALCPRFLGGAAVIARSFARIHETNLKKQGLLALTFRDPADWERIREDDRVSLEGLTSMAPHEPVACRLLHADGTGEVLLLEHSFTTDQLRWFRAGSALNLIP